VIYDCCSCKGVTAALKLAFIIVYASDKSLFGISIAEPKMLASENLRSSVVSDMKIFWVRAPLLSVRL